MAEPNENVFTLAYLNIHGQTRIKLDKQLQIEEFLQHNNIDVLHCQEKNISEDTFSNCHLIDSPTTLSLIIVQTNMEQPV